MAEEIEVTNETSEENRGSFFDMARKLALASIGAVVVAQEELESFVNKLIERGEIAENDGKTLITELRDKRREATEKAQSRAKKAQGQVENRMDEMLTRLNVPTKTDIDKLSKKIALLNKKVDEIKKAQAAKSE